MKKCSAFLCLVALFTVSGCQNPYSQFYTNVIIPKDAAQLYPYSGKTDFLSSPETEMNQATSRLYAQGYALLGYASFEANATDYSSQLRSKAKDLGADIVVVSSSFARTMTGVMPLMNYNPGQISTTHSSGSVNASAYSNRGGAVYGSATYTGQSTTMTPGTYSTNYIPYNVQRNSYMATFFRKRAFILGGSWQPLDVEQRRKLQRNTGVMVVNIVEGSPAFLANMLVGDILLSIDGELITTVQDFSNQLQARAGKEVRIMLLRDGKELALPVTLGRGLKG